MNPLREIPNALLPYLPDTLAGQGVAMAAGVLVSAILIGVAAACGVWLAKKMGYVL